MESISAAIHKIQSPATFIPGQTRTIPSHYNRFATVKDDQLIFDFSKCLAYMEEKGREQFGDYFRILEEDHELIFKLLVYAIRDQETAQNLLRSMSSPDFSGNLNLNLNLNKGIMLTGPVGCGKTSLMKLLRFFMVQPETYVIKSCREISFEFIAKGFEAIHKYSTGESRKTYCFDDLGTEQNLKYFGNECNVMAEILLNRYDQFIARGTLSHLTTNLSASEIEAYYGNRVRSRMREMFNLISFSSGSTDKRK